MKDLSQRIARHRRMIKKKHWHIDYLREHTGLIAAIPIRTSRDLECLLAGELATISDWQVPGFGSTDCSCATHLFGMGEDPLHTRSFIDTLLHFRMGLLEQELDGRP